MSGRKKNKSNNNGKKGTKALVKLAREAGPPRFLLNPVLRRYRMRWKVNTAVSSSQYNYSTLMRSLVLKSGIATEANCLLLFEAVRLRRIQMWAPAVLGAQVAFEATANQATLFGSDPKRYVDNSTNSAYSAYVEWKPHKDLSGQWINPASTLVSGAFGIGFFKADIGSIIDITFDATISDGSFPTTYGSATVTASPPGTYAFQWDANIVSIDFNMIL